MIAKPQDWEQVQGMTGDTAERLPADGYVCKIKGARMDKTQNGAEMFVVAFDIAEGEHAGYYAKRYEARKKDDAYAKWPGVFNLFPKKKDGTTNRIYKGFFTAVEQSNPGFTWNWDERSLAGKTVGLLFRDEEYRKQDGTVGIVTRPNIARDAEKIRQGDFTISEIRKLPETQGAGATPGFTPMEGADDDLPF